MDPALLQDEVKVEMGLGSGAAVAVA